MSADSNTIMTRVSVATNTYSYVNGSLWMELIWIHISYTTVAAGDRLFKMVLNDGVNDWEDTHAGALFSTAASTFHLHFKSGQYRETAFANGELEIPFAPGLRIPPGWTILLEDANNVDATDSMVIGLQGKAL